ncbi:hypothetical protein [Methyloversatilis thermotolerans]|uniref:hypothetical protein n=1 Tax=Methyloversatilis thermotolerans TaxID=1346290 RepID=UPI0003A59C82|nr:hypothetical protein [Methyloversatilis thermotolerans]
MRILLAACLMTVTVGAIATTPDAAAPDVRDWTVAGRLGLMQFIVVPEGSARDRDYYNRVIEQSCGKEETCFLRFFTNSTGATPAVPLPDAILAEPTAMFQRSVKQLREQFQWSCRLQLAEASCF